MLTWEFPSEHRRKYYKRKWGYQTFVAYCEERWGFSHETGRRFRRAMEVLANLKNPPIGGFLPENEAQLRPLTTLDTPEAQRAAWQEAVETAPT